MPKKKTHEDFVNEVFECVGDEYSVLGEYKNNMIKVLMRHNLCGHEWEISRANFINQNRRCPKCKGKNLSEKFRKTHQDFLNEVYELVGDEYTILSNYINAFTEIKIKHNICNCIYDVRPTNFIHGKRCPVCKWNIISKKRAKGLEQFKKEVFEKVGNEYEIFGEYKNNKTHILIKHNMCGYEYEGTPDGFLRGNRCPKCSCSKGENSIHEYLRRNNISYIPQYSFEDCVYKENLLFDFAIFDNEENLAFLIEFDGRQHYEVIDFFGGEEAFKKTKMRDKIKDDYCIDNEITLLRIPYWDYDKIDDILDIYSNS
jgi:predicted Zn-ribbon and HTH transcriptional regulator